MRKCAVSYQILNLNGETAFFLPHPTAKTEPTSQREQGPARPPVSFLPATHVCTGNTHDTRSWEDSALLPGETEAKGLR